MLADLRGRINTAAEYQRGEVWSRPQQQLLIDSLLRGFDLPKIFLRKLPDGSNHLFDVVDGVQRLTAIWSYLGDEYPLARSFPIDLAPDAAGKKWSELPQGVKDKLELTKITVTELETNSDEDIRELFQRLQQGEPLNAAERRNAIKGPVRDFVANDLATHEFWKQTGIRESRFGWHEMSAVLLALAVNEGPTGLKGADLQSLYEDTEFDPNGAAATQTKALLNELEELARIDPTLIRTRWGLVDLALALMQLGPDVVRTPQTVVDFFRSFEAERKTAAAELSDLRNSVTNLASDSELQLPSIEPDMLTYVHAFSREGASAANVRTRAQILKSRLEDYLRQNA